MVSGGVDSCIGGGSNARDTTVDEEAEAERDVEGEVDASAADVDVEMFVAVAANDGGEGNTP